MGRANDVATHGGYCRCLLVAAVTSSVRATRSAAVVVMTSGAFTAALSRARTKLRAIRPG